MPKASILPMSVTIEKPAFKDTTASVLLDLLRGLAALLVLPMVFG